MGKFLSDKYMWVAFYVRNKKTHYKYNVKGFYHITKPMEDEALCGIIHNTLPDRENGEMWMAFFPKEIGNKRLYTKNVCPLCRTKYLDTAGLEEL
jgi:hypothetical protein